MLSALQLIEEDLIAAARRQVKQRPAPRGRLQLSTLLVIGSLGLASAASAITGIGPLGDSGEGNVYAPSSAPQIVFTHQGAGGKEWNATAFRGTGDAYCVQAPPADGGREIQAGCEPASVIAKRFATDTPTIVVTQVPRGPDVPEAISLVAGIVPASTGTVSVTDKRSGVTRQATLTEVWTRGQEPAARAFLADLPPTDRGAPTSLAIVTQASDGQHTSLWPPETAGP